MSNPRMATKVDLESKPRRFVFVLIEQFTLLSFAAAVESLRIANRMAGREAYEWKIVGEGGEEVTCSAGSSFKLDGDLEELGRDDTMMLCGGINVQQSTTPVKESLSRGCVPLGIALPKQAYWMANAPRSIGKTTIVFLKNFLRSS